MPYLYRKLTPEERDRALKERRARGFPLHAPPHPLRDSGRYLITGTNFISELEKISAAIKDLHGKTAREWNLEDGLVGKRRVWYRFSDRKIRNELHFYRALNYVHFNPVRQK